MCRNGTALILLTLLSSYPAVIKAANILAIIPLIARSHFQSFQPLFEEIVKRGHNLTTISGYSLNKHQFQHNYTHVDISRHFHKSKIKFAELRQQNRFGHFEFIARNLANNSEHLLQQPEIRTIMKSNDSYDLVLAELFFLDVFVAFGYRFDAPVIGLSSQNLICIYSWIIGDPFALSFVPNLFLPMTEKMSFVQRTSNTVYSFFSVLYYEMVHLPKQQEQLEKYFHFGNGKNTPQLKHILKNISVTLVNTHYSFGYSRPHLPNVIETGGLHFAQHKPLQPNIRTFMDEALHGVIYVSLGSLIDPVTVKKLGKLFINVFRDIPQKVILKWNPKLLPDIPSNFLVQEWVPQVDILEHPNCRIFVTHGGLHSLLESLNSSVPVVGIPFFSDQKHNMHIVEYYAIGLTVEFENIEGNLLPAINEILENPKYKKNIEKRRQLFNERITSPLETAMYWVEYVLKHKDTSHFRSAALDLRWYQYFLLDVLVTLFLIVSSLIYIVYFIATCVVRAYTYIRGIKRNTIILKRGRRGKIVYHSKDD